MSSEYTPSRSRRPRRGDRRPGRSGNRSGSRNRQDSPAKPVKKTLWQKILALLGIESKEAPKSHRSHSAESTGTGRTTTPSEKRTAAPKERPSGFRKPEVIEVTSSRIYVGNPSFDASESDLFVLFNGVGQVQNVEVVANKHTHKSKGFAFVQMASVDEAKRAVTELHDKEYMGRKLVVSGAKALEEKRSERTRQTEEAPAEASAEPEVTAVRQPEQ